MIQMDFSNKKMEIVAWKLMNDKNKIINPCRETHLGFIVKTGYIIQRMGVFDGFVHGVHCSCMEKRI